MGLAFQKKYTIFGIFMNFTTQKGKKIGRKKYPKNAVKVKCGDDGVVVNL
jgi:hypothetical protein